jgi:hypothetical protein
MPRTRPLRRASAFVAALLLATSAASQTPAEERPPLGVFGTIPLYWGEAADLNQMLGDGAARHWARGVLEQGHVLRPLATLSAQELAPVRHLLVAQPRILSPAENVALDAWVRAGGRLLLFADPLLTAESQYSLGDPRRPQDVVLLSPLLRHWGLELRFDPAGADAQGMREIAGGVLPYDQPGQLVLADGDTACQLQASEMMAECTIGEGRVVIVADAAVLDPYHPDTDAPAALLALVALTFGDAANPLADNALAASTGEQSVDKPVESSP